MVRNLLVRRNRVSDLYSPLLILLTLRGVITVIQTAGQIVVACLALRGTAPEHRPPILWALRGKAIDNDERYKRIRRPMSRTGRPAP
jgi:hypothetical protein